MAVPFVSDLAITVPSGDSEWNRHFFISSNQQPPGHFRFSRGTSIQGYLAEMYTVEVSPDLISKVTDAVMGEVAAWQSRPLETMCPVVFFDALRVKIREDAVVRSKAVYLALGILPDGSKDILGL